MYLMKSDKQDKVTKLFDTIEKLANELEWDFVYNSEETPVTGIVIGKPDFISDIFGEKIYTDDPTNLHDDLAIQKAELEQFLKEEFVSGDYYSLTVLVQKDKFENLMTILEKANLDVAVLPDISGLHPEQDLIEDKTVDNDDDTDWTIQ